MFSHKLSQFVTSYVVPDIINVKRKPKAKDQCNQEWTIQRHWQRWAHKTQDEDKQNTTHKTKKMSNTEHTKNWR